MNREKYLVRVMLPVFVRTVVEVKASSRESAERLALRSVSPPPKSWMRGSLTHLDAHSPTVERVVDQEMIDDGVDARGLLDDANIEYALLQADLETMAGRFVAPKWLSKLPSMTFADIAQDWMGATEELYGTGVESFRQWLRASRGKNNVIDFEAAKLALAFKKANNRDDTSDE